MAGSSLLVLVDDIATVLDDVALMSKMAAKKTAGVLGDDLALNAQQVSGVRAEREIPVVWAVAKGSFVNKLILVPSALAISAFVPWLVTPLLMVGGAYLCFEGFEKLAHKFLHSKAEDEAEHAQLTQAVADPATDLVAYEKDKIKGAIRTDFILSGDYRDHLGHRGGCIADSASDRDVRHRHRHDCRRLRVGGGYRQTRRPRVVADPEAWAVRQENRQRHPQCCAVHDENLVGGRYGSDVPGRRRHPHPRCAGRASLD